MYPRQLRPACCQPSVESHSGAGTGRHGEGGIRPLPGSCTSPRDVGEKCCRVPGPRVPRAPSAAVTERRNKHQEDGVRHPVPAVLRSRCGLLTRLSVVPTLFLNATLSHPEFLSIQEPLLNSLFSDLDPIICLVPCQHTTILISTA